MSPRLSDVVVVGAGIVGASVAHRVAERGAHVTVIEANRPSGGASLASFAWVNAVGKKPRAYFDLNVAGIAAHRQLIEELGDDGWYHGGGNLEWSRHGAELAAKVASHAAWDYPVELLEPVRARELEPDVAIDDAARVALYPGDAWVDPVLLTRRLLDSPRMEIVAPAEVVKVVEAGERAVGVLLADGRTLAADAVVLCVGPRAPELVRLSGFELPMRRAPGLMAITEPAPVSIGRVLHTPGLAARPDGAGRLLLASDELDKKIEPSGGEVTIHDAVDELLRRARVTIPRLFGVRIESWRIGMRALTADGEPAIGPVPGRAGAYVAVTHSGVTLAPLIGRLVAAELGGDPPDPRLARYRPDRFIGSTIND